MFKDTLPNQKAFFETFQHSATQMSKAAENFSALVKDIPESNHYLREISACQQAADDYTQNTFNALYKAFVTPFDKYDMYQLACVLDNITYTIGKAAESLVSYKLEALPEEVFSISDMAIEAVVSVQTMINLLGHLKNADEIIQICQSIVNLQRKVGRACSTALGHFFERGMGIEYIVKVKGIHEDYIAILDECRVASDMVRCVVLDYS